MSRTGSITMLKARPVCRRSSGRYLAAHWSWRPPTAISRRPMSAPGSKSRSAAVATLRYSARRYCRRRGTTSPRHWRGVNRPSNCTPMAVCRRGADGCGRSFDGCNELANAVLLQLDLPMPEVDLSSISAAPLAPRRATPDVDEQSVIDPIPRGRTCSGHPLLFTGIASGSRRGCPGRARVRGSRKVYARLGAARS